VWPDVGWQAMAAHELMESSTHMGKIMLRVSNQQ
jgi:hypothetical protein